MKRLYIMLVLLCVILGAAEAAEQHSSAQRVYKPVLSDGKSWDVMAYNSRYGIIDGYYMFSVAGDTTVNGLACKKIKIVSKDNSEVSSVVLAHEENGKVSHVAPDGKITNLFDMSLAKGDVFEEPYYVWDADEILVNGTRLKRLVIDTTIDMADAYFYAVEGVGVNTTRFNYYHSLGVGDVNDIFFMLSCYENGERIFTASDFTAARTDHYHPLVREGVRWVNHLSHGGEGYSTQTEYYALEFHGDTIIGIEGSIHSYKKLYKYDYESTAHAQSIIFNNLHPVAYVREAENKVYWLNELMEEERLLYDFTSRNTVILYDEEARPNEYSYSGMENIGDYGCRVYDGGLGQIIESVGLVSDYSGDLLWPKWHGVTGFDKYYGLDRLEDLSGNVLYKSPWHNSHTEYQPLVREGVRWVNTLTVVSPDPGAVSSLYYYEFRGDMVINGKTYKKCYKYTGNQLDTSIEPFAAMREEGHKVYEVPLSDNDYQAIYLFSEDVVSEYEQNGEFMLFDFDDTYGRAAMQDILSPAELDDMGKVVPGVGFDSQQNGDAFNPFCDLPTGYSGIELHGFHHLEDLSGNVLYKGRNYGIDTGVELVVADTDWLGDDRWYSVTGVASDSKPTQPGIYIHRGEKVLVK